MSDLVVRVYNVGFGDAVLVSIPEADAHGTETTRHLLIDVGNLLAGPGNKDDVFNTVVKDIRQRTGGTVDLYVMTHEHMDHVAGLLAAANGGDDLSAKYAWLTGSAAPDYYDRFPDAKKQKSLHAAALADVTRQLAAVDDPWLDMMIRNNAMLLPDGALGLKTADYVDHLRKLAPKTKTYYVDRTTKIGTKHPFKEAKLRILAPEQDTSTYYGRRAAPTVTAAAPTDEPAGDRSVTGPGAVVQAAVIPPVGVDAGAFFDLVASRHELNHRTVLAIDKAANNTSVVIELEWRGWRLLFAGDAEERSWQTMSDNGVLRPVHFLKISHHGSINGTDADVLDQVLPPTPDDKRERRAVVSTHDKDWPSVPDPDTLGLYEKRCTLLDTRKVNLGVPVEIAFAGTLNP